MMGRYYNMTENESELSAPRIHQTEIRMTEAQSHHQDVSKVERTLSNKTRSEIQAEVISRCDLLQVILQLCPKYFSKQRIWLESEQHTRDCATLSHVIYYLTQKLMRRQLLTVVLY